MKTIRVLKSPRPPSLEAGSEPGALQTASAVSLDFQSFSSLPPLGGSGLVFSLPPMVEHFGGAERNSTNPACFHQRRSSRPILRSCGTPFRITPDVF